MDVAEERAIFVFAVVIRALDPTRMWRITSDLLLAFFAEHRDGAPGTLGAVIADAPELRLGPP